MASPTLPLIRTVSLAAIAFQLMAWNGAAHAQVEEANEQEVAGTDIAAVEPSSEEIEFQADRLDYDEQSDFVTATGNVVVNRDGQQLTADTVTYDRKQGVVAASGNVLIDLGDGLQAVADDFELDDSLKDGVVENVLLILSDGSRMAANRAVREDERTTLERAVYSPCAVIDDKTGCPINPVWSLKAVRVVHDPVRGRIFYHRPRLEMWGVPVMVLPRLSHPDKFDHSYSGILTPDIGYSRELGGELELPWLWAISPERDLKLTGHIYTNVNPVLGVEYRHLFPGGPLRLAGRITHAGKQVTDPVTGGVVTGHSRIRGYFEGNGQLQHGNGWRSTFSTRLTTDDSFPGYYQISLDTRLRSTYALENFSDGRYFSVRGWAFQGLRPDDSSRTTPIALPLVDLLWRLDGRPLGGQVMLTANSLGIYRREGQSMARALASARWDRSFLTPMGQRLTLTALARGDVYHTNDSHLEQPLYAGADGWRVRAIPLAAADIEWPMAGPLFGGSQTLTPRVQLVASTTSANRSIPNEDARAIDLEETNLFSLNRFPGYDRWEGGVRVTYGADWTWRKPGWEIRGQIGQSYRLDKQRDIFPDGTGLSDRFSDFVGRASIRVGDWVEVVQRLRLDKDSLAIRRAETDVALGSRKTFVSLGYLRFNRDIDLEDLTDHQELRVGARVAFARYWAIFGSAVVDLTTEKDNPATTSDGWQPIRHRLGISYLDECFDFSVAWKRNYVDNPNQRRGNSFMLSLALRNLG